MKTYPDIKLLSPETDILFTLQKIDGLDLLDF